LFGRRFITSASLFLSLSSAAFAAPVAPSWLQGLQWRTIGPFRGGRALAATGVVGEPAHFYFGAVNGGVWETHDAGRTWTPIFDDLSVASIGAIAVAPGDPRVIYVGSGEADMRSDIAQGDGMFRSDDGGASWRSIGLVDSQQIGRILVDPEDSQRVFVAALGHPYGPNEERGVFRSTDGGAHWRKVLGPDADTGAIDVAFDPRDTNVLYAALWQTRRTPWSVYPPSSGPGSGIYRSTDGGDHWTSIGGNGFPEHHGRVGFALARTAPGRLYAIVDAEPGGGLYRSDDDGAHWRRTSGDPRIWGRGWYFGRITVEPKDADVVYVLNTIVLRSTDGGAAFAPVRGDATGDDFHDLWIDPTAPERRILATDQGTLVSVDGGATWSTWHNQPTAQIYHVSTDDRFPYRVYGAQQDSGAVGLPSRSSDGDGITIRHFHELTAGGESDNIAPDPRDPDVVFGGRVERLDLRTEQTRNIDPTLAYSDHHRRTWTLPLVFSRREPGVLYFANQRLYRTEDDGEHWSQVSPDLTREDPGVPSTLDPPTAALDTGLGPRRGVIYSVAPSRLDAADLWVGTDDGLVWRSRDGGAHWSDVTPPELTPWSKIAAIDTSAFDADVAYVAVDRHRLDDFRPYVYRTRDGGAHWTPIVRGIAERHAVNVVREDPGRRGLLYAGTERGVYVSFDDGEGWQPLQLNLPVTSVRDIEVKGNDLVLATHGRGFWILDDVSSLRQVVDAAGAGDGLSAWLFAPAPAVRFRPQRFTGTPFPPEEPKVDNPPAGARIDYFLAASPAAPVVLTILDEAGSLVRRYSSDDRPPAIDPARLRSSPDWVEAPVALEAGPGMHRFVWPLRYAPPAVLGEGDPFADGVWAPPGRYTVTLEVDGQRLERSLEVTADPRLDLPQSSWGEAFALARRIEGESARVAEAAAAARKLQRDLSERRAAAPPEAAAILDEFQQRLSEVNGVVPAENPSNSWWLPPHSLDSLRAVGGKLDDLQSAVDGADAAPSRDARDGFAATQQLVESGLAAWDRLRTAGVAELDEQLEGVGQAGLRGGTPEP
jgi:photosystem II stability/assembly factor-like uncharacterized protein